MKTPHKAEQIDNILNPLIKKWFYNKFKAYSLPQTYGVMEIHSRNNILISAPTGATKTLTGFLSILNELIDSKEKEILEDKVYCVYISPLKALNQDIAVNLISPLKEMEELAKKKLDIRVAVRTGDTTQAEKSKMLKNPPHILITTPESLAIMLSSIKFKDHLRDVQWCIVDEIHALAENKRGTYLSLTMERLQRLSPGMTRVGLSATISPLDSIAKYLVGYEGTKERPCKIVDVQFIKQLDLKVLSPVPDLIDVQHGNMHNAMYGLMHKLIQDHKTTLIFTNTRAATERIVHNLKEKYPKFYNDNNIGAHHGSLSKEHRHALESELREGKMKVACCSTSLELGIDIGFIDLVIMLGSPKSVARALQRCLSYNSNVLCGDGKYRKIGEIVEKKMNVKVISYDEKKGFVKNKIKIWHNNGTEKILNITLKCGEQIKCTKDHPILTKNGWKKAIELKKEDLVAEVKNKIKFEDKSKYIFELLPKNKTFVANKFNFFQKVIDKYRKINNLNLKEFSKLSKIPYAKLIDCRRITGRKKSIRLDYFLKACNLCKISKEKYLPHFAYLKSKGRKWSRLPLKLTEEIMWLAGIIATDGCIVRSQEKDKAEYYKIKIGNKSKVMVKKIKQIVNKFDTNPYIAFKEGTYRLEFGLNLFAHLFMSLGIPCKRKSYELDISNQFYSLPSDLIYAYLEGVFEGDGNLSLSKNKTSAMIRIFTASKKFANGLHLILSRLGHYNKISKNKIKSSKLIKKVSNGNLYCVGIYRKEDLKIFFTSIPCFGEKAKKGRYLTKKYTPYLSIKKEYNLFLEYSKIISIKNIKTKQKVYNLTLENEPNNFIVGNVIVHNCGRSGHKLHDVTKGRIIVLDRDDLVECAVLLKSAVEKKIDKIHIPTNALDVLAQQIYGIAIEEQIHIKDLQKLVKSSYCYKDLAKKDFMDVMDYLTGKHVSLEDRHIYAKIWHDEETGMIGKRGKLARVLYMTNIGTIPDETSVRVKVGEQVVGTIDEGFLERLKPGDVFVLGGNVYQFKYSRGMTAQVNASVSRQPTVPRWFSEMLPLSFDLALEIGRFRKLLNEKFCAGKTKKEIIGFINNFVYVDKNAAESIYRYFDEQFQYTEIPSHSRIIIEHYTNERGMKQVIFHTLYGRRVNDCLSRAIAFAISRTQHRDVEIGINDNGFYISSEKNINVMHAFKLIKAKDFKKILNLAIDKTEVLKRRFRHCAARSLMILRTYKGRTKRVGRQQVSSTILINAVKRISEDFSILKEARREVLEDLMDIGNAQKIMDGIEKKKIIIKEIQTTIPSPFAFNLIAQGITDILKIEDRIEFLRRMHQNVLAKISLKK